MMSSTVFISGHCVPRKPRSAGVTLVEFLVAFLIAGIALFGLAIPFFSERSFWRQGDRQVEAQRDAQVGLRAMARSGRTSSGHDLAVDTSANSITFDVLCSDGVTWGTRQFTGTPGGSGQFQMTDSCSGQTVTFIDGNHSEVTAFQVTAVTSQLVRVQIQVTRKGEKNELLETEIYLRNAA